MIYITIDETKRSNNDEKTWAHIGRVTKRNEYLEETVRLYELIVPVYAKQVAEMQERLDRYETKNKVATA